MLHVLIYLFILTHGKYKQRNNTVKSKYMRIRRKNEEPTLLLKFITILFSYDDVRRVRWRCGMVSCPVEA